ncbi:CDP-diacylglycerol--serine O-phosphatidyltransferase [Salipaludibacillus keqinensis]|uniref:CDP-diacylglycerol--serine O-phosphatidyltransferase n=1 Tax=Salipaludibacillus keqinensis TaxID=2045207 RepID=A0A323TJD5_9BACI|nr:CDP-diacylglycerol--serine O-phosphatidyltransferase [Salipaludibacillus keqinensis]PYZ95061.1 CDP-diacylglycerol--serine O-phosphatidyltransferase [Salipaludibacillus keqinensis]
MLKRNIPNGITMSNLIFGFLSIGSSFLGDYQNAAIFILIGMMLDSMDGWMARKLGVESAFGKELDSLADIVTFGVAPAILIFGTTFSNMGMIGLIIAGMFPVFGAIRLARFNIDEETSTKGYFTGVPITAAGGVIALLTIFNFIVPQAALSAIYTLLCVLMVSKLKIPSLKEVPIPKYGTIITALLISLLVVTRYNASIEYSNWIIVAILVYLAFMLIHFLLKKKRLSTK